MDMAPPPTVPPEATDAAVLNYDADQAASGDVGSFALRLSGLLYAIWTSLNLLEYIAALYVSSGGLASNLRYNLPLLGAEASHVVAALSLAFFACTLSRRLGLRRMWTPQLQEPERLASTLVAVLGVYWIIEGFAGVVGVALLQYAHDSYRPVIFASGRSFATSAYGYLISTSTLSVGGVLLWKSGLIGRFIIRQGR